MLLSRGDGQGRVLGPGGVDDDVDVGHCVAVGARVVDVDHTVRSGGVASRRDGVVTLCEQLGRHPRPNSAVPAEDQYSHPYYRLLSRDRVLIGSGRPDPMSSVPADVQPSTVISPTMPAS
jgi:hypothetical protein